MSTTNAFVYGSGGENHMVWRSDLKVPEAAGKDEVIIKVISAGLNPVDYKIPHIWPVYYSRKGRPVGYDVCGVVQSVGKNVKDIAAGDKVFGSGDGLCNISVVKASTIAKLPEGVDPVIAGGTNTAALTAYQMLKENDAFEGTAAKKVVVIGASGGVGSCAIQIAKSNCPVGSVIYGVCSGKNAEFVRSLGADEVLDYSSPQFDLSKALPEKSIDVVVDCVTSPGDHNYLPEGMRLIKEKTGRYVAANTQRGWEWIKLSLGRALGINLFRGQYSLMMVVSNTKDLTVVGNLMKEGKLKLQVQEVLPFTEESIRQGYKNLQNRRTKGKIIVKMD